MGRLKEDHVGLVIEAKTEQAQQEIRQLERATADLRKEMKLRQNAMLELESQGKKESEEYKRLQAELKGYNAQIKENENKLRGMRSSMDITLMTTAQLKKHAKELQRALDNTSKAANPKEYERLSSELKNVKSRMADLKNDTKPAMESLGNSSEGVVGKFKSMFSSIGGEWTKLVGMASAAVASITAVIEGGKWWYNYNAEIEEAQRLTREFTGLTGDALINVRSEIQALSNTFGKDYKDVLGAVDGLMAQYGITAGEAMEVVKDGFVSGADLGGNMLSLIGQYAPSFHDAGIGASELVAIIAQTRSGIFSEGGMALIQMASKRVREMSKATEESLNSIGINSKQLKKELKDGTKSTFDAIQMISEQLKKMPQDSQEVGNVLKDVFGRQGAAGGLKMIESLAEMTTKMEDVKAVTGEYGELQEQEVEAQTRLNEKMSKFFGIGDQGFEEITMKAKVFALNALSKIIDYTVKIINYFINLYNKSTLFRLAINHLKADFLNLWEIIKLGALLAIDAFKAIGRMASAMATVVEGVLSFDIDTISAGAKKVVKAYSDTFNEIIADGKKFIKNFNNNMKDSMKDTFNPKKVELLTLDVKKDTTKTVSTPPVVTEEPKGGGGSKDKKKPTKKKKVPHTTKKSADPDDVATKNFAHDRKQDIEEATRAYQEDLNVLKEALAQKRIKQEEYNAYITALNIQHQNNLLNIEKDYQQRANATTMTSAEKRKSLIESQDKAVANQHQAATTAYIDMEKQYYGSLEQLQKMAQSSAPQTLQQELDTKLMMLEGYYKTSLQMAGEDAARQLEVAKAYEAAKAQITTEYAKKLQEQQAQARQQYGLETFEEHLQAQRQKAKEDCEKKKLTEEQYQQALTNIENQGEEHRLQLRQQYGLASQQEIFDAEMAMLKQHLDNKEITEAEYEEAKKNLKIQKAKEAFDYFANLAGGAVKALQDAEMANVDAKYDAEIESAKQAGKDTSAIEKKKAEEKLKIQKKYADVDFAIKASQIIADTSVAIMRAYDDLPLPAAIAASVLIGATGIAQLAAANAERQKVKRMSLNGGGGASASASGTRVATGLESGGSIDVEREQDGKRFHAAYDPNRRGFIDKPTVIVGEGGYGHSKEWVASNAAVENPTIAPILDIMDRAQRAGNIRTLDMNKFLLQQAQGRAAGGSVTKQAVPTISQAYHGQDAEVTKRLIELLEDMKTNGVRSIVGLTELDAKQQLQEQIRKVASK
ncbi:hypothetical protein HMPREF9296_2498 [Prevotella disiens FB035-09AN]|uniref:Phage tail tape measure protein, TP901 family n=1 Tax=Prevotella disiens FB035-09AN TaxID=866771 RepID=E1KNW2_9BACT|nr:phage tail tape measure protein [Prevotella disiens]EFL46913.1 hypothetical protein HMPREF9296_2498 [Prevotella disiens FB035-09AN]